MSLTDKKTEANLDQELLEDQTVTQLPPGDQLQSKNDSTSEANSPSRDGNKDADKRNVQRQLWCEWVGLSVAIIILSGICALPIIFYHLPKEMPESIISGIPANETCSKMIPYNGSVCKEELRLLSGCIPPNNAPAGDSILVQSDKSDTVDGLLDLLNTINLNEECKAAAVPFLCVHFFGLCDSTGRAYRPSSSQCTEISTGVCSQEWELAGNLPGVTLPDCASFPVETIFIESCYTWSSEMGSADEGMSFTPSANQTCTCNDDFFCKQSTCVPKCGSWKEFSQATVRISDALLIPAAVIGFVSAVVCLVIAGVRRKTVMVFPTTFVVFQNATLLVQISFYLIHFMGGTGLYCSSEDLLETIMSATPFCVLAGIMVHYLSMQIALCALFYSSAVFWIVRFPFHARRLRSTRLLQYIHFATIFLALVLPVIPAITPIINYAIEESRNSTPLIGNLGFGIVSFPPTLCSGTDQVITYYTLILPLNLIMIVAIAQLLVIFWTIHKQLGLFQKKESKIPFKLGTAEKKILVVICYFVVFVLIGLIALTVVVRNSDDFANELTQYFICEASGPNKPCSREGFERLHAPQPALVTLSSILACLFPLVILMFVADIQGLKEKLKKWICPRNLFTNSRDPSGKALSTSGH